MGNKTKRNAQIAKNTLFLYLRMILVTIVSFFTARITLQVLGVEDFGIQNIVTSIVSFIGIVTGALTSATQRFLAFNLGENDINKFQRTFSSIIVLFLVITLVLAIIAWCIGPWFIQTHLTIPSKRMDAAIYTYVFSIVSLAASMLVVPFSSAIIAYEKMGVFARLSIFESIVKLLVVYLLYVSTFDKLVTLAFLNCMMQLLVLGIYIIYCKHKLEGCTFKFVKDFQLFKQLINYIGWNIFGYGAGMTCTIGINICLNIFFGPLVNAAKGIADKINQIVTQLSNNFYMAVSPQIIKSYAAKDFDDAKMLVYKSSKYAYFLVYMLSLPLILLMKNVLEIWLGAKYVTNDMILFSQWIFVFSLVNTLETPISMLIRATGDIKKYQIWVGSSSLLVIPICYMFFKYNYSAISSMVIWTTVYAIIHCIRVYIANKQVGLSVRIYLKDVVRPIACTTIPSAGLMWLLSVKLGLVGVPRILILAPTTLVVIFACMAIFGLNMNELRTVKEHIFKRK